VPLEVGVTTLCATGFPIPDVVVLPLVIVGLRAPY